MSTGVFIVPDHNGEMRGNMVYSKMERPFVAEEFAADEWMTSPVISCDGYYDIGLHLLIDAAVSNQASLQWYDDPEEAYITQEFPFGDDTSTGRAASVVVKAPYFTVTAHNGGVGVQHITVYAYLKS